MGLTDGTLSRTLRIDRRTAGAISIHRALSLDDRTLGLNGRTHGRTATRCRINRTDCLSLWTLGLLLRTLRWELRHVGRTALIRIGRADGRIICGAMGCLLRTLRRLNRADRRVGGSAWALGGIRCDRTGGGLVGALRGGSDRTLSGDFRASRHFGSRAFRGLHWAGGNQLRTLGKNVHRTLGRISRAGGIRFRTLRRRCGALSECDRAMCVISWALSGHFWTVSGGSVSALGGGGSACGWLIDALGDFGRTMGWRFGTGRQLFRATGGRLRTDGKIDRALGRHVTACCGVGWALGLQHRAVSLRHRALGSADRTVSGNRWASGLRFGALGDNTVGRALGRRGRTGCDGANRTDRLLDRALSGCRNLRATGGFRRALGRTLRTLRRRRRAIGRAGRRALSLLDGTLSLDGIARAERIHDWTIRGRLRANGWLDRTQRLGRRAKGSLLWTLSGGAVRRRTDRLLERASRRAGGAHRTNGRLRRTLGASGRADGGGVGRALGGNFRTARGSRRAFCGDRGARRLFPGTNRGVLRALSHSDRTFRENPRAFGRRLWTQGRTGGALGALNRTGGLVRGVDRANGGDGRACSIAHRALRSHGIGRTNGCFCRTFGLLVGAGGLFDRAVGGHHWTLSLHIYRTARERLRALRRIDRTKRCSRRALGGDDRALCILQCAFGLLDRALCLMRWALGLLFRTERFHVRTGCSFFRTSGHGSRCASWADGWVGRALGVRFRTECFLVWALGGYFWTGGGFGWVRAERLLAGAERQCAGGAANRRFKRTLGGIARALGVTGGTDRRAIPAGRTDGIVGRTLGLGLRTSGRGRRAVRGRRRAVRGIAGTNGGPRRALGYHTEDRANGRLIVALRRTVRRALGRNLRFECHLAIRRAHGAVGLNDRTLGESGLRTNGVNPRAYGIRGKLRANR